MTTDQQQKEEAAPKVEETDEAADAAALWEELDAADNGEAAPDRHEDGQDAADDHGDDDGAPDEGADQPDGDEPPGKEKTDEPDLWADAPPALRAAYEAEKAKAEKLEHSIRSEKGRQTALQRQLEQERQKRAAPPADKADDKAAKSGVLDGDDFKAFKDEYPEVAGPIENAFKRQAELLARFEERLGGLSERDRQTFVDEQYQAVIKDHADYDDATKSPEFREWFETAPAYVQDGVRRNGAEIVDAQEVSDLMAKFKRETGYGQTKNQTEAKPDRKRQSQLNGSRSPGSRGRGVVTAPPDDPEAYWKYLDEQERQQQARA